MTAAAARAVEGEKRQRGRPRIHDSDADRAKAHRESVQDELATLHMLRVIFRQPTPKLFRNLAEKIGLSADDKAKVAADVIQAVLEGLAEGGGTNCAEAGANYARYEYGRTPKAAQVGAINED